MSDLGDARIVLLDHGYIELVEMWGSDERVVEAARMSTGKGFLGWGPNAKCPLERGCGWAGPQSEARKGEHHLVCPACGTIGIHAEIPGDEKLLRYLYENAHATPFEMAGAVFEVKAPIFVFREWHRHRTQSYNEMSARYTPLPDENYVPTVERLMMGGGANKQAQGTGATLTRESADVFREVLVRQYLDQQVLYEEALKVGVPKELARVHLPVGRYSRMRASANLRNWLAFMTLRMAPNAQWEIRQYANALHDILQEKFPRTLALFDEGRKV